MNFERTILRSILFLPEYREQVLPFLKSDFFEEEAEKYLFKVIAKFIKKYNAIPKREALITIADKNDKFTDEQYEEVLESIKSITTMNENKEENVEWLIDETEKYCQERAIYNAVSDSLNILEGEDKKKRNKHCIPELLREALSVNFRLDLGHDYHKDVEERYDYFNNEEEHIPCDLTMLNRITNGGVIPKTLNIALGDTNVGKSIFLCHLACAYKRLGYNVLYCTMELSEEEVARRIDANLLNIEVNKVGKCEKKSFLDKNKKIHKDYPGEIKIKEFPSRSAHAGHIRTLMKEYELKDDFKTDILIVDYTAICASEMYGISDTRHDLYLQYIISEFRNLAKEFNIPVWTVHQLNREAHGKTEADSKTIADSYGALREVDISIMLLEDEDLIKQKQILVKQNKNRYASKDVYNTFLLGVNKAKMKFYDVDDGVMPEVSSSSIQEKFDNKKKVSNFKFE